MRHYVSVMLLLLAMMAHAADGKWAGTWATAIEPVGKNDLPDNLDLANSSIRQVVKVSTGGPGDKVEAVERVQ